MLHIYKPVDNLSMIRGGARNLSDGSKSACIKHLEETVDAILQGANGFEGIAQMLLLVQRDSSKSLVIYNDNHYLLQHARDPNSDCIVINKESVYLYNTGASARPATLTAQYTATTLAGLKYQEDPRDFIESIAQILLPSGYSCKMPGSAADESLFFVIDNKAGSIILDVEENDTFGSYRYDGALADYLVAAPVVKEVKTQTETKMEEKTMSKVNAIVTANKSAAQTAVRIEAGNIALDKLGKLIAPRMPFGTASYIKTPLGKVVMANLISFAIQQYAGNNPKAKIISEAVMEAAALELVQSFNIGAMIDDLVSSVNLSGLEEPTGLDKYTVKAE